LVVLAWNLENLGLPVRDGGFIPIFDPNRRSCLKEAGEIGPGELQPSLLGRTCRHSGHALVHTVQLGNRYDPTFLKAMIAGVENWAIHHDRPF
jgi:hypothetical protein